MVIVNWKNGLYSMQAWGKIGFSWGLGEMILGDSYLGVESKYFGVYQRRKGRKHRIIVKTIYQVPPDPKTPAQLASRAYMGNINILFKNLSDEQLQKLLIEGQKKGLNRFQIFARYMQLQRPTYLGVMECGFSYIGEIMELKNI